MTVRALLVSICLASLGTAVVTAQPQKPAPAQQPASPQKPATAQTPAPPQTPAPVPRATTPPAQVPPPPAAPRREGQAVNIKVDVTITDMRGGTAAAKKTVSVVAADNTGGFIRSQANYFNLGEVPLNVDTEPFLLPDGKIRVRVNLQYELPAPSNTSQAEVAREAGSLRKTSIHENLSLILENGKPIVAAQSADPVGDRQVTIEVKATVLR